MNIMLSKLVNELNQATTVEEAEKSFPAIADVLLNKSLLEINGKDYRLMEIEFYFLPTCYKDPFVHNNKRQALTLEWYFHRKGEGGYSNDNYKGLDLTIGNGTNRGGILIRAFQNIATLEYQEGSSSTIDLLMRDFNETDILTLAPKLESKSPFDSDSKLKLKFTDLLPPMTPTLAPRHGLRLTDGEVELRKKFIFKKYRYILEPSRTTYGKNLIFLSLLQLGNTHTEAADFLKIRKVDADKYATSYERGKTLSPDDFVGLKLTIPQKCALMGAIKSN
jgi:hypothetical protein